MRYMLNDISHYEFFSQLEKFKHSIDTSNPSVISPEEHKANIRSYIKYHVNPYPEILDSVLNCYEYEGRYDYYFYSDESTENDKRAVALNRVTRGLQLVISYLSIIDSLLNPETDIIVDSISEKSDFLLNKLNKLFGEEYYSISKILELNNVTTRTGEERELAEDLHRRGYVILKERYSQSCDMVKISVKGAAYIERKLKPKKTSTHNSELNKKIDNIIVHLTTLGYGQEIIFNEIEELRELQTKLSKKSWSQLLKGKLIDLTIDKIISSETATSVYEYLTSNTMRLLK